MFCRKFPTKSKLRMDPDAEKPPDRDLQAKIQVRAKTWKDEWDAYLGANEKSPETLPSDYHLPFLQGFLRDQERLNRPSGVLPMRGI